MPLRPKMDLRDYGKLFLRRKWVIVFTVLSILFAAIVYCVITPELYKSSITILIIPQTVPEDYVRSTVSARVDKQLATIRQQLMSRTTLTKVMDELHLFKGERRELTSEDLISRMRKRIQIDVVYGQSRQSSEAFSLSFLYEDPKGAMHAASRLASLFIDENLKTREHQAVGTSDFLESQMRNTKARLEVMERRVKDYKMQYMGELPQQMDANLRVLTGLQDRLRNNETNVRTLEERKDFLQAQISLIEKSTPVHTYDNGNLAAASSLDSLPSLENELALKREKLAALTTKYTEKFPEVVRMKREVADLENRIEERGRRSAAASTDNAPKEVLPVSNGGSSLENAELRRMRAQLKSTTMEIGSLKKEGGEIRANIASVELKVAQSPRREQEMISLVRDYDNQKRSYDDLLKKKLEADVSQNLEKRQKGTQFQILDPANLPEEPFQPNRKMVLGISFVLALVLGFGVAIVWEMMDLRLRDVRDFRHFYKVPILAYIPTFHEDGYNREAALRRAAVFGGLISITMAFSIFLLVYRDKIRTILNF